MLFNKKSKRDIILSDVDSITQWLEKRNLDIARGKTKVSEQEMPTLARIICGGETEVASLDYEERKVYTNYIKDNGKRIAGLTLAGGALGTGASIATIASGASAIGSIATLGSALGTGTSAAALASGMGATLGSGLSIAGMGATAFIPALWPVGISMLAVGAGTIFKKNSAKKENVVRIEKLENIFNESHINAKECNQKIQTNNKKINLILSQKLKATIETLTDASKKIAINIDDALNKDQNLRIMQYQEIVLKQYNSQNEIRKMLADLVEAYNKLVVENEELARKVEAYEAIMKMCGCANNYMQ